MALAACVTILAGGVVLAAQPAAVPPGLGFTAAGKEFHFDTGVLRGTLRADGHSLGIFPMLEDSSGKAVAGPTWGGYGVLSPYRMLSADARYGTAAWDWPSRAKLLDSGAVESRWSADKDHPFDMTARYRFSAPDTLDLTVTVVPRQNLRRFELFLSSYFWGFSTSFAYVRDAGVAGPGKPGFIEAVRSAGEWQMFPRPGGGGNDSRRALETSAKPGELDNSFPNGGPIGLAPRCRAESDRGTHGSRRRLFCHLDASRRRRPSRDLFFAFRPRLEIW